MNFWRGLSLCLFQLSKACNSCRLQGIFKIHLVNLGLTCRTFPLKPTPRQGKGDNTNSLFFKNASRSYSPHSSISFPSLGIYCPGFVSSHSPYCSFLNLP
ncbi:hypothetical protein XELAEV_18041661mg [Xenopus laevis]|uniref:Secreted protein n=1 Tax=Xenopus laevis TaxID=8355 RepID=A0A974H5M2_XENLA|nr:hypothetical protein XELAEV_18041661mg [Xenopus laevis]